MTIYPQLLRNFQDPGSRIFARLDVALLARGWYWKKVFDHKSFLHRIFLAEVFTKVSIEERLSLARIGIDNKLSQPNIYHPNIQGVPKKFPHTVWIISTAANTLDGWDISHLKSGICSSIWSTKTFLFIISEPRYRQNNKGYQISRIWNDEQVISWNLIPQGFIHNFSSYAHFRRRGYILPSVCFRHNPLFYTT